MSYDEGGEYGDGANGTIGDDVYMSGAGAGGGYDDDEDYGAGGGMGHGEGGEEDHDEYDPTGEYGDGDGAEYPHMEDEEDEMDPLEEDISQEDAWVVISAYFSEKGLVRQQLDSFDEVSPDSLLQMASNGRRTITVMNKGMPRSPLLCFSLLFIV